MLCYKFSNVRNFFEKKFKNFYVYPYRCPTPHTRMEA